MGGLNCSSSNSGFFFWGLNRNPSNSGGLGGGFEL